MASVTAVWAVGLFLTLLNCPNFADENDSSVKARLEVKAFINEDSEKYPDLEVKYIGGIDPVMVFLKDGEETERVVVAEKSRDEIHELLASHGLNQRVVLDEEEPAEPEEEQEALDNGIPELEEPDNRIEL